jgi:hypothetical protein
MCKRKLRFNLFKPLILMAIGDSTLVGWFQYIVSLGFAFSLSPLLLTITIKYIIFKFLLYPPFHYCPFAFTSNILTHHMGLQVPFIHQPLIKAHHFPQTMTRDGLFSSRKSYLHKGKRSQNEFEKTFKPFNLIKSCLFYNNILIFYSLLQCQ